MWHMEVPQPRIELTPNVVEEQSLKHWTTREIPPKSIYF